MENALLDEIEDFLARHGMAPSAFGAAFGDRHFVRQVRKGRRVWPGTAEKVRTFMREHEGQPQVSGVAA